LIFKKIFCFNHPGLILIFTKMAAVNIIIPYVAKCGEINDFIIYLFIIMSSVRNICFYVC
jgi:hypothetical protein